MSVNLSANLEKTRVVNLAGSEEARPGFYCKECDCSIMDSLNYLDHINGARHQQNLGRMMRVERSTPQEVRQRILELKKLKKTPKIHETFEEKMKRIEAADADAKRMRKLRKAEQKMLDAQHHEKEMEAYRDEDCAQLMGFAEFGVKAHKRN